MVSQNLPVGQGPLPVAVVPQVNDLDQLTQMARNMPDVWVCEVCRALHPVTRGDTPAGYTTAGMSCPLGREEWGRRAYASLTGCRLDARMVVQIDHRHVQLALKWARLKHIRRLSQFMAPAFLGQAQHYPAFYGADSDPTASSAFYLEMPRIVPWNGEPRFVVKSVWTFFPAPGVPISWDTIGELAICPHIFRTSRGCFNVNKSPLNWAWGAAMDLHESGLAFEDKCPCCPTEYLIRIWPQGFVQISAWKDFGAEESPENSVWRSHCLFPLNSTIGNMKLSPHCPCPNGNIRKAYELAG
ncbi:hypothetical protein F5Y10DRAFT_261201 [Nemania abortiva]|nr:hypothetical protein F5Y10DRAFT_261201 [Nemania abortiva]